jgi:hypothetical protein
MWDLIKEVFDKDKHPVRRVALATVLGVIAAFAAWKSIPEGNRAELLRPLMERYAKLHAPPIALVAADSANALEGRLPALSVAIDLQYFSKANDARISERLVALLRQRGVRVTFAKAIREERSNAVWCGTRVPAGECVLVALRMIQSGFPVTQVFRFPPDRDRPTLIQIGYNDNLGRLDSYSPARLMVLVRGGLPADRTPR